MKRLILILTMVLGVFTLKAQVVTQNTSSLVTVKDSTFIQDARLNYAVQTIYPAIVNFIEDYNSKVKLEGKEITMKAETNQFIRKYEKALADYQLAFLKVDSIQVDSLKVVTEFQALEAEIQRIDSDQEIKLSDAKKKVAEIRLRQQKLSSYYNQIIK